MSDVRAAETAAARDQQPSVHIGRRMARQQRSDDEQGNGRAGQPPAQAEVLTAVTCSTSRPRSTSGSGTPARAYRVALADHRRPGGPRPAAGTRQLEARRRGPLRLRGGIARAVDAAPRLGPLRAARGRLAGALRRRGRLRDAALGRRAGSRARRAGARVPAPRRGSARAARGGDAPGRAPVVACDGLCPRCGRLRAACRLPRQSLPASGSVVIDDTQAVGLLGEDPTATPPYGSGGGGTPRHLGVSDPALFAVASFAKAFGAPVAALLGVGDAVRHLRAPQRLPGALEPARPRAALRASRGRCGSTRARATNCERASRIGSSASGRTLWPAT